MTVQNLLLSCPLGKRSYRILSSKDKTLLKRPLLCLLGEITDHSGGGVQEDARLGLINDSVVVCSCLLVFALGDTFDEASFDFPQRSVLASCPRGGGCSAAWLGFAAPALGPVCGVALA